MSRRHECPGRCGRTVPLHQLACRSCWRVLPEPLQAEVSATYAARRRAPEDTAAALAWQQALVRAVAWYRERTST